MNILSEREADEIVERHLAVHDAMKGTDHMSVKYFIDHADGKLYKALVFEAVDVSELSNKAQELQAELDDVNYFINANQPQNSPQNVPQDTPQVPAPPIAPEAPQPEQQPESVPQPQPVNIHIIDNTAPVEEQPADMPVALPPLQ